MGYFALALLQYNAWVTYCLNKLNAAKRVAIATLDIYAYTYIKVR